MQKTCKQCRNDFEITDGDLAFYDRVSPVISGKKYLIPKPKLCPDCRCQQRLAWRSERFFYHRGCDLCDKKIISMYRPGAKFPVYCSSCWWGDGWSALDHGCGFDFNRPFFEQFDGLANQVPHFALAMMYTTIENSDYCNQVGFLKNCYLIYNSDNSEQCFYGKGINRCFDCMDCFKIYDCEACYECSNCNNCTFSTYLIDSYTSDKCHFSANLIGCKDCFGSVNLRNKKFCFFNEELGEDEYKKRVEKIRREKSGSEISSEFLKFREKFPMKWMQENKTENCTGDYLVECKDCFDCYDCEYLEKSKYCNDLKKGDKVSFDNNDISYFGMGLSSCYQGSVIGYNANHVLFSDNVWDCSDLYYSQQCMNSSHDLFGSFGIKRGSYCVLNKKYSKEDYEKLVASIINHMKETGEWGEFFDISSSPYSYFETNAHEYYPMEKEEVLEKGWKWETPIEPDYSSVAKKIPANKLPDTIDQIPDEILDWAIECEDSGRLFKILKGELDFYRKMNLPVPHFHPDVRHFRRLRLRNPRKLRDASCGKCGSGTITTISGEFGQNVYCQQCYLSEVY